jgi:hypothetical protein
MLERLRRDPLAGTVVFGELYRGVSFTPGSH